VLRQRQNYVSRIFIGIIVSVIITGFSYADNAVQIQTKQTHNGSYHVTLRSKEIVQVGKMHEWLLTLRNQKNQIVNGAQIKVSGGMPHHGHGFPTSPRVVAQLESGEYLIEGMKFTMKGQWVIDLKILVDGKTDQVRFKFSL
jgi:hypothetical protein